MRDEQDNLRRNIFGYHDQQADGSLEFVDVSWQDTFFENRLANNPILFSALSHASLSIWQKTSGEGNERFSLTAVRLPAFLAGIASLAGGVVGAECARVHSRCTGGGSAAGVASLPR